MPELVPLTLTITQEGKPLAGAFVTLYPDDGSQWSAGGESNESGEVALFTRSQFRGVAPGKFNVTVAKMEQTESTFQGDPEKDPEGYNRAESRRIMYSLVDPNLLQPSTTTLTVTVEPEKLSETLDIGKAVRVKMR